MNIHKLLCCLFAFLVVANFSCQAASAQTLTCGGTVFNAGDGTSADGGNWTVYNPVYTDMAAQGTVGQYASGYWAGEVGAFLDYIMIGDELIGIIEKELNTGTVDHSGYYALMDHQLTNSDPAQFTSCSLRQIPMPAAGLQEDDVILSWDHVLEDSLTQNILGYNIYRGADGISFTKINDQMITKNTYTDTAAPAGTQYYALGLVYRGTPNLAGTILSRHAQIQIQGNGDFDNDGDVDGKDLLSLIQNMSSPDCPGCLQDMDGNGIVDATDIKIFSGLFGTSD